jgi:5-methylcytosine-specific restriction endonuclease McrBC regulatory subunit McrC
MELIITKDNQLSINLREILGDEKYEVHLPNLRKLSEHPIKEIKLEEHPNLLIFPQDFKTYGDEIGKEKIFEIDGDCMVTGNIMGFVGYNGTQVSIRSRFAKDDGNDYFLHYMLQKVLCLNVFNLDFQSDSESIFDFLIYLFPGFLKEAMRQGTYREYQVRRYNDANIRGRIDIARHIRQNNPFTGNVAYSTREYVADNHVTQLIRHTIEYIKQHPIGGNILNSDEETREAVGIINACTPTYNRMGRQRVISQNLRPLSHPYYYAYRDLQRLCMRILRHEEMKYGADDNQIHGILFDGAWLWEEYLNTFIKNMGFTHPRNKTGEGRKLMFVDPKAVPVFPDFYLDGKVVLDAKYKRHETLFGNSQREDRFQVLAYMHIFNVDKGGLIVPVPIGSERSTKGNIAGRGGEMYLIGMAVDKKAEDYKKYCDYMASEEDSVVEQIKILLT